MFQETSRNMLYTLQNQTGEIGRRCGMKGMWNTGEHSHFRGVAYMGLLRPPFQHRCHP